jgi:3',5'-cyclic AMP phosphodiesterase CpdA
MVRILHVTDIHFGCENAAAVEAVRAHALDGGYDLIVQSGDMTMVGCEPEFIRASEWLKSLPEPQIGTPGNHDTPEFDIFTRVIAPWELYRRYIGSPEGMSFRAPGLAVEAFNTSRGVQLRLNWSKGACSEADVDRVVANFADAEPRALKVAVCHHPLLEVVGGPMTARVRGGEAAAERLCHAEVDLVLTGHIHMPFAHPLPFGDGKTYAVGGSTLSQRERGVPAGYNCIEADDRQIRVTAMGWVNGRYEAQKSWGFDRRRRAGAETNEPPPEEQPLPLRATG